MLTRAKRRRIRSSRCASRSIGRRWAAWTTSTATATSSAACVPLSAFEGLITMSTRTHHDVVVIGAGFGGLGARESSSRAMGAATTSSSSSKTWASAEPGMPTATRARSVTFRRCCTRSASHPPASWSKAYPGQAEIEAYLNECVARFELAAHLRMRTKVTSLDWNGDTQRWTIKAQQRGGAEMRWTCTRRRQRHPAH